MNRANNFYDNQIIDRELNKPSFLKILFSDYGKAEIYEKSRSLFLTSLQCKISLHRPSRAKEDVM